MEYTQWGKRRMLSRVWLSLNPCCNGIYSMSSAFSQTKDWSKCLNPCCNGIYSMSNVVPQENYVRVVLILVVMEYTQWVLTKRVKAKLSLVLILVVMEYTQWVIESLIKAGAKSS